MLKVDLLKREVTEARRTVEVARGEYETIKARHGDEFNRLEKSRCASFKRMWLAFARTQAAHAERAMQVWRAVAEDLGASPEEWRGAEEAKGGGDGEDREGTVNGPRWTSRPPQRRRRRRRPWMWVYVAVPVSVPRATTLEVVVLVLVAWGVRGRARTTRSWIWPD